MQPEHALMTVVVGFFVWTFAGLAALAFLGWLIMLPFAVIRQATRPRDTHGRPLPPKR